MAYDPNEPRDKEGKWTKGSSGHNAGGGNRTVAKQIVNQHKVTAIGRVIHSSNPSEGTINSGMGALEQTHTFIDGPKGKYKIITHDPREFLPQHHVSKIGVVGSSKSRTVVRTEQKETLHEVERDGKFIGHYRNLANIKRRIKKGSLW